MQEEIEAYESSYEDISIHELMLKDECRTLAYKHFIYNNPKVFHEKIVLDVGAGTGILSLFAAKTGAKRVYAVEVSNISKICKKIVEKNKMDSIIQVIQGRIEDINLPEKVDVIISEWMGFYLLHESMLQSLIRARDRFLKPDGLIVPSKANLYACPTSMKSHYNEVCQNWKNIYGFDFSPVSDEILNPMLLNRNCISRNAVTFNKNSEAENITDENIGCTDSNNSESVKDDGNKTALQDETIQKSPPVTTINNTTDNINKEPKLLILKPTDLLSDPHLVTAVDLLYADPEDFESISTSLSFTFDRHDILRGIALWFNVIFDNGNEDEEKINNVTIATNTPDKTNIENNAEEKYASGDHSNIKQSKEEITTPETTKTTAPSSAVTTITENITMPSSSSTTLSTSPYCQPTHWKQTIIPLPEAYFISPGSKFKCELILSQDAVFKRRYNLMVEINEVCGDDNDDDGDGDDGMEGIDNDEDLKMADDGNDKDNGGANVGGKGDDESLKKLILTKMVES